MYKLHFKLKNNREKSVKQDFLGVGRRIFYCNNKDLFMLPSYNSFIHTKTKFLLILNLDFLSVLSYQPPVLVLSASTPSTLLVHNLDTLVNVFNLLGRGKRCPGGSQLLPVRGGGAQGQGSHPVKLQAVLSPARQG